MKTAPEYRAMRAVHARIRQVPCPQCGVGRFVSCMTLAGKPLQVPHQARRRAAADAGWYTPGGAR